MACKLHPVNTDQQFTHYKLSNIKQRSRREEYTDRVRAQLNHTVHTYKYRKRVGNVRQGASRGRSLKEFLRPPLATLGSKQPAFGKPRSSHTHTVVSGGAHHHFLLSLRYLILLYLPLTQVDGEENSELAFNRGTRVWPLTRARRQPKCAICRRGSPPARRPVVCP